MKLVSWNINSVRLRIDLLGKLAAEHQPDVICLQETKTQDQFFPEAEIKKMGYDYIAFTGEKSYNGVAILSKLPLANIQTRDMVKKGDKRHISAVLPNDIEVHNFYIPAGGDVPDPKLNPKFAHKLDFVDEMTQIFSARTPQDKMIIVGDFNIAPLEHDVWSHKQLLDVVSHTPIEVKKLNALKASRDWCDTHREFTDHDKKLYSWWSYRARDWEKSARGRRLDHIWITPNLRDNLQSTQVIQESRGWQRPSDHAVITAQFHRFVL
jgi:exodeoxyribonuclease-3